MNNGTYSNKPQPHTYFVSDVIANLPDTTALQPAGTAFINGTNAAVTVNTVAYQPSTPMIAPGQVQVYNGDTSVAVDASTDPTTMQSFFIAQGRDTSNDVSALQARPFEQSKLISTSAPLKIKPRLCQVDVNNAFIISNIVANDNVEYNMTIAYRGKFAYKLNARNAPASFPAYTVEGTWTQLGISAAADQLDYVVQGLAYNINRTSQVFSALTSEPIFAIALEDAGSGVALSTIAVGDVLTVAYKNGNTALPVQVTVTNGIYGSIQALIASSQAAGTDTIVIANPSDNGGTSGTGATDAEKFAVIALDRPLAFTDREPSVKYRIEVACNEGFNVTVNVDKVSANFEGFGLGRQVQLDYASYAELNKQFRVQAPSGNAIQYPTDISLNRAYLLIDIEGYEIQEGSTGNNTPQPFLITIAVPCCDADARAAWDALLNGFFASMPNAYFEGSGAEVVSSKEVALLVGDTAAPCASSLANPFKTA